MHKDIAAFNILQDLELPRVNTHSMREAPLGHAHSLSSRAIDWLTNFPPLVISGDRKTLFTALVPAARNFDGLATRVRAYAPYNVPWT